MTISLFTKELLSQNFLKLNPKFQPQLKSITILQLNMSKISNLLLLSLLNRKESLLRRLLIKLLTKLLETMRKLSVKKSDKLSYLDLKTRKKEILNGKPMATKKNIQLFIWWKRLLNTFTSHLISHKMSCVILFNLVFIYFL